MNRDDRRCCFYTWRALEPDRSIDHAIWTDRFLAAIAAHTTWLFWVPITNPRGISVGNRLNGLAHNGLDVKQLAQHLKSLPLVVITIRPPAALACFTSTPNDPLALPSTHGQVSLGRSQRLTLNKFHQGHWLSSRPRAMAPGHWCGS